MMERIKRTAASIGLASMLWATAATAADLGGNAPHGSIKDPPYVPRFSWAGPHIGLSAGGAWAEADRSLDLAPSYPITSGLAADLEAQASGSLNARSPIVGGQIGYNFQRGVVVFGVEADINALDLGKTADYPE